MLTEYLLIWDFVDSMVLDPAGDDQHLWMLSTSGKYSSKSAYVAFFHRIVHICTMETHLEKLGPVMLQALHFACYRFWTADRLAKRGLTHPAACPLCDNSAHPRLMCFFKAGLGSRLPEDGSI